MNILFTQDAWADYLHWQQTDRKLLKRVNDLIRDIARQPDAGIGKPEPLRFTLESYWSRRIDREHRLVYKVEDQTIVIIQCRYHYE